MIHFEKFTLENGLKVIVNKDTTTPIAVVNILYNVGARDEDKDHTGFAHLFEHLMFGGSVNIPDYDMPVQLIGGENNAFTSNDITNYYLSFPTDNIETAFWAESDRMLQLDFSDQSLEVQKNVVIEEFKQRYLNQPYGDIWLHLRPLAYKVHPYQWPTIGKDISHIENATLDEVKDFFYKYYAPNNAILSVVGNVETDEIKRLAEKWFGGIERRNVPVRSLPKEPQQTEKRELSFYRDVPFDAIYKAYHVCNRNSDDFHTTDLISDLLSFGRSSRFYQSLVREKKLFSNIDAFLSGDIDESLLIIAGNLIKGTDMKTAEAEVEKELERLKTELICDYELNKIKNKIEASFIFSEINSFNRAMNLAYYELLGDANYINLEVQKTMEITAENVQRIAKQIFVSTNCSTIYYYSK